MTVRRTSSWAATASSGARPSAHCVEHDVAAVSVGRSPSTTATAGTARARAATPARPRHRRPARPRRRPPRAARRRRRVPRRRPAVLVAGLGGPVAADRRQHRRRGPGRGHPPGVPRQRLRLRSRVRADDRGDPDQPRRPEGCGARGRARAAADRGRPRTGRHRRAERRLLRPRRDDERVQRFVVDRIAAGKRPTWLFDADQPHSLTATTDIGDALVTLGTDDRATGRTWHLPTAPALTGRQYVELAGVPAADTAVMSSATLRLGALYGTSARETLELRYQYTDPYVFDSSAFEQTSACTRPPPPTSSPPPAARREHDPVIRRRPSSGRGHPALMAVAGLMVVSTAVCLVGLVVELRTILGAPAWMKPLKFSLSILLYAVTWAWLIARLPKWRPRSPTRRRSSHGPGGRTGAHRVGHRDRHDESVRRVEQRARGGVGGDGDRDRDALPLHLRRLDRTVLPAPAHPGADGRRPRQCRDRAPRHRGRVPDVRPDLHPAHRPGRDRRRPHGGGSRTADPGCRCWVEAPSAVGCPGRPLRRHARPAGAPAGGTPRRRRGSALPVAGTPDHAGPDRGRRRGRVGGGHRAPHRAGRGRTVGGPPRGHGGRGGVVTRRTGCGRECGRPAPRPHHSGGATA